MRSLAILALAGLYLLASGNEALAQRRAQDISQLAFDGARTEIYKTVGDVKLRVFIFDPPGHTPAARQAAIVFFFGGGWTSGTPAQFEHHCRHLAQRGMVAMTAEYRVASRHNTKATACVQDAKSALRWARREAPRLGIDPDRLAAGGGSAGGHLAACTGVIAGFDEPGEDLSISSRPNSLALFNPALVLAPVAGIPLSNAERLENMAERMGTDPVNLSPYHHVGADLPPCIIFHGKADTTVPYRTAELFQQAAVKAGGRCELRGYDDQSHGFFNYGRGDNRHYQATLKSLDDFLVKLGYLPPQ